MEKNESSCVTYRNKFPIMNVVPNDEFPVMNVYLEYNNKGN